MRYALGVLLLCCSARAEVLTLLVPSGAWHDPQAWDAGRVPTLADFVIVPPGMTCTVSALGPAFCSSADVGGLLVLDEETLVIGTGDPDVDPTLTLDGQIEFMDLYEPPARIVPNGGWLRVSSPEGTGELYASRNAGGDHGGAVRCCAVNLGPCVYFGKGIVIEDGVTIRGSLRMHTCMVLDGQWIVDDPADVAEVGMPGGSLCGGLCPVPITLAGAGEFIVSAGRLEIGNVAPEKKSPRIRHDGGTVTTETALRSRFR